MNKRKSIAHRIITFITLVTLAFLVYGCDSTDPDPGPDFDSGLLAAGESFSFTFQEEGTVNYYCRTHAPSMTGQVIVEQGAEITDQDTVVMENTQFNPSQITIAPGASVVWINRESAGIDDHTVTSGSPESDDGAGDGY